MKKCSTAALLLAAATVVPALAGTTCEWLPAAPETHRVERGDTLWDLASIFLKNPWCWPRVWERNRDQIANPHRIYPGQLIVLDRQSGQLRLQTPATDDSAAAGSLPEVRRGPSARAAAVPEQAPIPVLAPALLASATRFRLAMAADIAGAPRILGFGDRRRMAAAGDIAYVGGELAADAAFDVLRQLETVRNPDDGEALALPLLRVGKARVLRPDAGGLQRVLFEEASAEIMAGDLLLRTPATAEGMPALQPATACEGRIAALLHEGRWARPGDVVMLNRGRRAGLGRGSLVAVTKQVRIGADESRQRPPLATQTVAALLVFDTLEQAALALVMHGSDAIGAGDTIGPLPATD